MKLKPIEIFAPIERVNDDARTVEAYAFVNEVVEGEGGMRLKRTSMEAATPDYMAWANVRRMHQPDAVGVAHDVQWDERGARMTVEVVDDDAWNKVKRGVYKGLSVGVVGTVVRGKDVEKCRWIETSLVDRPKDPDARILVVRAEDADAAAEFDAEELPDATGDPDVQARMARLEQVESRLAEVEAELEQKAALQAQRFATLSEERDNLATRLETAEGELAIARADLTAAKERIVTLERQPVPQKPPVRFPHAVERTFAANEEEPEIKRALDARAEIKRLSDLAKNEPDESKRADLARQIIVRQAETAI